MADAQSLTLAFLRAHPPQAARVLETLPAADAAALFTRVPARLGAIVLKDMLPAAAARSIAELDDDRAMELLGALGVQPAVVLLRHIAEPRRTRLISGLPAITALASRALLGYAEDSVGAWIDPDVIALGEAVSAHDALERVRSTHAFAETIFVVEGDRKLVGEVALAGLLRAASDTPLGAMATKIGAVIAAHAPLAGALQHPGWKTRGSLPVVQQGSKLVGVLTQATLVRAVQHRSASAADASPESLSGILAHGYWEAFSGLLQSTITLLPAAPSLGDLGARPDARR